MFRCQLCGTAVPPRTPSHGVVVQSRPSRYPSRPRANRFRRYENRKHKVIYTDDPGGTGRAIVKEVRACAACAAKYAAHGAAPASLASTGRDNYLAGSARASLG